jgi:DNA-binding MarR family transcriptional regulator
MLSVLRRDHMFTTEEKIAELIGSLPMHLGSLLAGIEIKIPVKLNFSEGKTLIFLHKNEGNPMSEYSKKVGLTKGSFTAVADRLEKKGLIKRIAVSDDRRKNALILTKEGKSIAKKIDLLYNRHISNKIAQLEEEDIYKLKNALETTVAIMEKIR